MVAIRNVVHVLGFQQCLTFKVTILEIWEFMSGINTQEYNEKQSKMSRIIMIFKGLKVNLEAISKL